MSMTYYFCVPDWEGLDCRLQLCSPETVGVSQPVSFSADPLSAVYASTKAEAAKLRYNLSGGNRSVVAGTPLPMSFMMLGVEVHRAEALDGKKLSLKEGKMVAPYGVHFGEFNHQDRQVGLQDSELLTTVLTPCDLNIQSVVKHATDKSTEKVWSFFLPIETYVLPNDSTDGRWVLDTVLMNEFMAKNTKGRKWNPVVDDFLNETELVLFRDLKTATFLTCLKEQNIRSTVLVAQIDVDPSTIQKSKECWEPVSVETAACHYWKVKESLSRILESAKAVVVYESSLVAEMAGTATRSVRDVVVPYHESRKNRRAAQLMDEIQEAEARVEDKKFQLQLLQDTVDLPPRAVRQRTG